MLKSICFVVACLLASTTAFAEEKHYSKETMIQSLLPKPDNVWVLGRRITIGGNRDNITVEAFHQPGGLFECVRAQRPYATLSIEGRTCERANNVCGFNQPDELKCR